jgi:cell volume regulation protein A
VALEELEFPEGAAVALIVRGDSLIPAKGATVLEPGDHAYVIAQKEDLPLIRLMFGRAEAE